MTFAIAAAALYQSQTVPHRFLYESRRELTNVSVAGSFNGWNKDASPMRRVFGTERWVTTLPIAPGKHQYKFVLNGSEWIVDPKASRNEDDGAGNVNSILMILPQGYDKPGIRGDGEATKSAILHEQATSNLNLDRGRLSVSLRTRAGDLSAVRLRFGGAPAKAMRLESGDEIYEFYRASVPWNGKSALRYNFELRDGSKRWFFGPKGATKKPGPGFILTSRSFTPVVVPSWVEKSVFYQIFPDRFANGSADNDPVNVQPWTAEPTWFNRFGGDVAGVVQRLGHLKSLGVNAVYFNPIMKAPSNHRYDPVDYFQVDPEFGTNDEFAALVKRLKGMGIRTVLDQIFDHSGVTFPPFEDVLQNQQRSKFTDYFFIKSYPVSVRENPPYEAWFGFPSMPKLNLKNRALRDYLLRSVDFWQDKVGIAGWRLDVANEVPQFFWKELRKRVKARDPEAYIVGEAWGDAGQWLKGDQWDASMNYPWRDAVVKFVAEGKMKAGAFLNRLMATYRLYAPQVSRNQLNMISSHDTPRFLTLAGGDRELAKLGAIVQFTWVGSPSIYYGEELGMEGGADPLNRRPMRWDLSSNKNDMLAFYKRLVALRLRSKVLQQGDPFTLGAWDSDEVAAYGRVLGQAVAVIAINRSERDQTKEIDLPLDLGIDLRRARSKGFVDGLSGKRLNAPMGSRLRVRIPARGAVVALCE